MIFHNLLHIDQECKNQLSYEYFSKMNKHKLLIVAILQKLIIHKTMLIILTIITYCNPCQNNFGYLPLELLNINYKDHFPKDPFHVLLSSAVYVEHRPCGESSILPVQQLLFTWILVNVAPIVRTKLASEPYCFSTSSFRSSSSFRYCARFFTISRVAWQSARALCAAPFHLTPAS